MSESTASFDYEDVSMPDDSHDKKDILRRQSVMDEADVHALIVTFGIPANLHPRVPPVGRTMNQLPDDAIGLYAEYLFEGGLTVPFSTLLLEVIRYFKVHLSQLVPLRMHRVTLFEVYCRSMHITPTTPLFRVFYKLSKQASLGHTYYPLGVSLFRQLVLFGSWPYVLPTWGLAVRATR